MQNVTECDFNTKVRLDLQLNDIFGGKSIHVSTEHGDYVKLKRYVIAYGGEMESGEDDAEIVVVEKRNDSDSTNSVTSQWIYDCIRSGEILKKYY